MSNVFGPAGIGSPGVGGIGGGIGGGTAVPSTSTNVVEMPNGPTPQPAGGPLRVTKEANSETDPVAAANLLAGFIVELGDEPAYV